MVGCAITVCGVASGMCIVRLTFLNKNLQRCARGIECVEEGFVEMYRVQSEIDVECGSSHAGASKC